jgi:putative phage-type endonuclease
MGKIIDMVGKKKGRLTIVSFSHKGIKGSTYWEAMCDCGNITHSKNRKENSMEPHLIQNSEDWKIWRRGKLGASDAPILMNVSKWTTPWQLYMRKLGLIPEQADNRAMEQGRKKESECLEYINRSFGTNMVPVVMQHKEYPWMIASLDGWDAERRVGCEIKCSGKEDNDCAMGGNIPEHYIPQTQQQVEVIGDDMRFFYASFNAGSNSILEVHRDDEYIEKLICVELDFMRRLRELDPPELCDRDYVENHSREWKCAVNAYNSFKRDKEHAERDYEEARAELIRLAGDHNTKGNGAKVAKVLKRGNIDYQAWCADKSIEVDWDAYRKPSTTHWRVTEE